MRPPQILHNGKRPSYWKDMVADCARNLRLSKRERDLLFYYCDRSNYFRPSLKVIQRVTGIRPDKVSPIRSELVKRGLIAYEEDTISIDWFRIRSFAMIPPLSKHDSLNGFTLTHMEEPKIKSMKYHDPDAINWRLLGKETPKREFTEQEENFIHAIENMTESEYLYYVDLAGKIF